MKLQVKIGAVMALVSVLSALGQSCSQRQGVRGSGDSLSTTGCSTPAGFSGVPASIDDVVLLINALPKPVTVACFLESLRRPLGVNLTSSTSSAQPANSFRSPRVFLLIGNLVVSIVPEGSSSEVVEFSVMSSDGTSIKGEIGFPVMTNLARGEPYDRIRFGGGTACRFCHTGESRASELASVEAYRSIILKPSSATTVPLDSLKDEYLNCDSLAEPKRCDILRGLFGYGEVRTKNF